jgi:cytochrome c2|tara:strand:- start:1206 stop:1406 length:201 start_codon:yes stop_codon:yes gene_type:complete
MEDHKIRALKDHYKAQITWAASELTSYLEYPSAVGEHTFLETMDKLVQQIAENEDKLVVLETHFNE